MVWYHRSMSKKYIENNEEFVPCPICKDLLKNSKRSVGSHIGYHHKEEAKKLYNKEVEFTIECKECNSLVANSNNVLARHLHKEHNIEWSDYLIKNNHSGIWPLCLCGCGEKVRYAKGAAEGSFRRYIKGHDSRGENNPMFGKKGEDCPNYGKKRTEEHKKKYSEAAKKRWADPNDIRRKIMKTKEYKQKMREHAIKLLAEGKIGPQAPYRTEWKHNPFTDQKEYMHSSWETIFLDYMIKEGIPITKKHDFRFKYKDSKGDERAYIPDFVGINDKIIYEVKGGMDTEVKFKTEAAKIWCKENGYEYILLYKKEIREIEKKLS